DGGRDEIYVMNADCATGVMRLTFSSTGGNDKPSWSPDGTMIVFHYNPANDQNYDIFKMNANGTGQVNLTNHPSHDSTASWQPDADSDGILPPDDACPVHAGPPERQGCPPPGPPAVGGVAGLADEPDGRASDAGSGPAARDYAWPIAAAAALMSVTLGAVFLGYKRQKR
ncbi:MAG TPA: hypothetical protein VGR43_09410, partial [Dehalococcoidia bacterium]|nr:hypothetical protein [Dehalococcoidia bacterium]